MKTITITLAILSVFGVCLPVWGQPWDGGGVEGDPYLIYTPEDMQAIGGNLAYWGAHFELMADIDLVSYTGTAFNIIGRYYGYENPNTKAFTGVFDGNGHTINNFSYTCTDVNCIGLFGYLALGEIKNLGLLNANVDAGMGDDVGSLVGRNSDSVSNCYATGAVMGGDYVGGLTGRNFGRVSNCYATVDVTGYDNVGGLAGLNVFDTISNCYATGAVTGGDNVGGFVGDNFGNISVSFWDTETSGEPNGVGSGSAVGVTGKTTAEMQTMSTFLGWGSEPAVWTIDEGNDYPRLAWESQPGEPITPVLSDLLAGAGTESEPYLIYTDEELNLIGLFSCEWDKHFKLMVDIDLSGFTGTEFNTIGTNYKNAFTGSFDGNGHTISNFTYTSTDRNYIGLFRYVGSGGEIKELDLLNVNVNPSEGFAVGALVGHNSGTVSNCSATGFVTGTLNVSGLIGGNTGMVSNCSAAVTVTGDDNVGGLVGYNYGTVLNCNATGTVTGTDEYIGGLVGRNYDTVSNCYATGSVTGTDDYVGGLVGNNSGTISDCYVTGSVLGGDDIGGLVGRNYDMVSDCYATGTVTGNFVVGGLVGYNADGTVSNCYATGPVTGTDYYVGGLVGYNYGPVSNCYATGDVNGFDFVGGLLGSNYVVVLNCYTTGDVTGNSLIGGLIGQNREMVLNCYAAGVVSGTSWDVGGFVGSGYEDSYVKCFWDSTVNPLLSGIGNGSDPNVTGETTENMQRRSTFTSAGWDFVGEMVNGTEDIWRMCVDDVNYPMLWWEFVDGDFGCPDGVDGIDLGVLCEEWLFELISADVAPNGGDGVVNFLDWADFATGWQVTTDYDGLADFAEQWLKTGASYLIADIAPAPAGDEIVNWLDFAVLAEEWLN